MEAVAEESSMYEASYISGVSPSKEESLPILGS